MDGRGPLCRPTLCQLGLSAGPVTLIRISPRGEIRNGRIISSEQLLVSAAEFEKHMRKLRWSSECVSDQTTTLNWHSLLFYSFTERNIWFAPVFEKWLVLLSSSAFTDNGKDTELCLNDNLKLVNAELPCDLGCWHPVFRRSVLSHCDWSELFIQSMIKLDWIDWLSLVLCCQLCIKGQKIKKVS